MSYVVEVGINLGVSASDPDGTRYEPGDTLSEKEFDALSKETREWFLEAGVVKEGKSSSKSSGARRRSQRASASTSTEASAGDTADVKSDANVEAEGDA